MALHSGFTSLNANTDTFSDWLNKTNEISALIIGDNTGAQTSIMTANDSGSWTHGDAILSSGTTANGEFFANIVSIVDGSNTTSGGLQGAKYSSANGFQKDWLYISTNTAFSNTANIVYVNATDKLHVTNNTEINQHLTVSNTGGYAFFHGNTHVEERFEVGSQTTGAVRSTTVDSLIVTGANVEWYDYSSSTTSSIRTNDNGDLIVDADVTGVGTANTTITLRVDNSDRATFSAANIDFYNAAGSTVGMRWTGSILELGEAQAFQIYNDGANSYVKESASGNLFVQANNLVLEATDGTNYIQATAAANVEISYAGNVQISTTSYGVVLDGEANTNTLLVRSHGEFDGTINVDGDATFNANIVLGDSSADAVTFNADVDSNILPTANGLNLGEASSRWDLLAETIDASSTLNVDGATTLNSTLDVDGIATFNNTTAANSTSGSIQTDGGISIAKNAYVVGNTDIDGSLTVDGVATFNGSIDLGNAATDTVSFVADVDTDILPSANGLNLGGVNARWDLLGGAANFSASLTVDGLTSLNSHVDLGDAASDNITINGRIDSNVIPDANVTYDIGSSALSWNNVYSNNVVTDYLTVNTDASFPDGVSFAGTTEFVNIEVTGTANILSLEVSELVANGAALIGTEDTVTTTSATVIDSYPKAQSKGLKYIVQGQRSDLSTAIYGVEIMLVHNDTDVFFTRYGEIDNQMSDVVITPVANSTHINLQAVCDSASVANTHTFNIVRIETR